ncbi:hypothetical protein O1611_g470 [Lasiodiplodia mahajangana]|uniref:Uncharacterized protein n=1 Tax=Lasiodiplodia mahajangana TaxID=1108764 RepID=A0ACC2K0R6_9PEZI|nr:hypothetical protein O1611_g470 [Lasiodiplodia mahajangana]
MQRGNESHERNKSKETRDTEAENASAQRPNQGDPQYSGEGNSDVRDQDNNHSRSVEQVASGLDATTIKDSHTITIPKSPDPRKPRKSRPKIRTGCISCKQRRIKCNGERPGCSNCVRTGRVCLGYPPPPRSKLYDERALALKPQHVMISIPNADKAKYATDQASVGLSKFDISSEYKSATPSLGAGIQADQLAPYTSITNKGVPTRYNEPSGCDTRTQSAAYIFADDLFTEIGADRLSAQIITKISHSLPTLLRALALNIGFQCQTKLQYDIMVFIETQRLAIVRYFRGCYYNIDDNLSSGETSSRGLDSTEAIDHWLASVDVGKFEEFRTEPLTENSKTVPREEFAHESELPMLDFDEYKRIIIEDPAYTWMLARIRRDIILEAADYDIVGQIEGRIRRLFARQIGYDSRMKIPEPIRVTFTVDWDIIGFLRQQKYSVPPTEAIATAVTLTGTLAHAQALPCWQYMAQMWPLTGSQILKLIQETLNTANFKKTLYFDVPSQLTLEASILKGSSVIVTASGLPDFVVEVGEQLAWLGSALRPSSSGGLSTCAAHVVGAANSYSNHRPSDSECILEYRIAAYSPSSQNSSGHCWSHLFSNPVLAQGFPILRRSEKYTGLEMPLDLMVALTGTKYLNTFNSNLFIKGFNTMLVPVKKSEDSLIWHLLHSKNPTERISYLSSDLKSMNLTIVDLEKSRHVLGWCDDAISIVGTTRAIYDIERSRLPKTHSHHLLEKVEVSSGQFVTGTAAFTLGNREKPIHISRFGFLTKLQWISSKHVVLWDEVDKRGWLIDGASALLHILRASLAHSKRKFQSAWLLDISALKDPGDPFQSDAALRVLINEENRNLTLYMDKTDVYEENVREGGTTTSTSRRQTRHYRLEDKIEHIYNILEKLIDHQTDMERRSGLQINMRPRRQLEGWDFADLVRDGDPIFPRATTLPTIGKGWVDFARAIHTITLFGRGFGDLIQPRQTDTSSCSRWSLVPKNNFYLTACASTLRDIMEEDGDAASNPRRLCDNIIWHMKQTTFEPCPCTKDPKSGHHEPVQALFPLKFTSNLKKRPQVDLKATGAVIFGHNTSLHWHWKDTGDPVKGDPPPELGPGTESSEDSGIGSSASSLQPPSASDPSSPGSTGDKSPIPHPLMSSTKPQNSLIKHPKRALEMFSSVTKKTRQ